MMSARRSAGLAALFAVATQATCVGLSPALAADGWPARPIRLVVPFPPGGGSDASARILVPKLGEGTGQQWVVDNRGGAAGNIATDIVASAAPDGHTVLLGFATALTVNPTLYPKLPNIEKTLQPITKYASAQYVLVVHPTVKAGSVAEFVALAKAAPGRFNYSSAGVGSPLHLAAEMFRFRAGVDIVNVAYKGGGPAAATSFQKGFNNEL